MSTGKKKNKKIWSVSEKLEVVRARQKGITLDEIRSLYGIYSDTVYKWTRAYEKNGISGLEVKKSGPKMKELSPKVEAAEKIVKEITAEHPGTGIGKVQGVLYRHGLIAMAKETVRRLLGRKKEIAVTKRRYVRNKPYRARSFERAKPNELWQTDIMGFMLKGQYRTYMIGFMDDYSRFIVGWGLYRFQTAANVQEVFRAAIEKHGLPKEVLSDNGRQYYTWRGKSKFSEILNKLGIRHIRSRPYHPQTLGKIESFWRNLLQECLSMSPISSFEEAQNKIGEYIEYYNFKRPHQGIGNLMPSDRFYSVDGQVQQLIKRNTEQLEDGVIPSKEYTNPVYLVGNLGGQEIRLIARDAQLSLEKKPEEMVELNKEGNQEHQTETTNVEKSDKEITGPAGAAGLVDAGNSGNQDGKGVMPGSGGIAGAVLPVDEETPGKGAGGTGSTEAGPEKEMDEEAGIRNGTHGKAGGDTGEEASQGKETEGAPGACAADSAQDNQAAGLGQGCRGV